MDQSPKVKRTPPTTEQIRAEQKRQTDKSRAAQQAAAEEAAAARAASTAIVPATSASAGIAVPEARTSVQQYLDEVAPASIVGRMIKFSKDGRFITQDDGEPIGDGVDFIALCDQTLIGRIRFNGEGEPPNYAMGLLYDGYVMPPRETLGDSDPSRWELGLDGKPQDPWQHFILFGLATRGYRRVFFLHHKFDHRPARSRKSASSLRSNAENQPRQLSSYQIESWRLSTSR
jgi:hypothetical protein